MELVYPIYLDTPMMTAFLASLEGGVLEEANVESKTSKGKETSGKISFGAKVSNLISAFADINAQADVSGKATNNLESQYKGTVKFPNASLFIRLRNLLTDSKSIKTISTVKDFSKVSVGDLVEIQGNAKPSPNYELGKAVKQLMPIAIPAIELQIMQIEADLDNVKKYPVKNNKGVKQFSVGDEIYDLNTFTSYYEKQIKEKQNQLANIKGIGSVVGNLFMEDSASNIIFESNDFKSVCKVYPAFSRNERIEEIFGANWYCLGKVIGKIEKSDSYDLFKGLPVGLLARNIFSEMASGFKTDELDINVSDPVISGECLIIAVLAIFA